MELVVQAEFQAAAARCGGGELVAQMAEHPAMATLLLRAALAQVGDANVVLVSTNRRSRLSEMVAAARGEDPNPQLTAQLQVVLNDLSALADVASGHSP